MLKIFFKTIKSKKFKQIKSLRDGAWIHVENVNKGDLKFLAKYLRVSDDDLKDSLDMYELPRFERIGNTLFIFIRLPSEKSVHATQPLTIIINPNVFITITLKTCPLIDEIIVAESHLTSTQQFKLLLSILLKINKLFNNKIHLLNNEVVKRRTNLYKVDHRHIVSLIESEAILNQYLAALTPMENVFELLVGGNYLKLHKQDEALLEDVLIEVRQSAHLCSVILKSIVSLRDAYQIMFSNQLNKTMRLLTVYTIILTIPTIIGSFWGMNVPVPFQYHYLGFVLIIAFSIIVSIVSLLIFRYKKWL